MTINQVSTTSIQQILTSQLQAEQSNLAQLSEQLATSKKYTDLTDYSPSDALNILNLQDSSTQRQAYIGVINTVQTRLSGYDTTMTDMESVVSQAQALAAGNPNYSAASAPGIAAIASNFLKSVSVDLDQQIGGRYIYAGSRYTTEPVTDLTTLTNTPSSTILTDGASLPVYDSGYSASATTTAISGQTVTFGGTPGSPQNASVTIGGTTYTYAVQPSDTLSTIAAGLASVLNTAGITGSSATGAVLTVGGSTAPSAAAVNVTDTAAYATDSATIDSGYTVQYGVTSNSPAFQQLISGLQFLQAAGNATDNTTYQANLTQATTLLTSALSSIEGLHSTVANNINSLTDETTSQNTGLSNITDQIDNIQQVDLTQVSTELNLLQTQLQASYSATGTIERMSIVQYL
jgi:flagellin-like hook-associated protein FlgL